MKRYLLTLIILLSFGLYVNCQRSESEIALKEYFADAEFFLTQEYYKDALNDFIQVYKRGYEDNYNINYRIGVCYLGIPGQKDKAIPYLEKAREGVSEKYRESTLNEKYAPIDVHLYLGNAYRVNNRLADALASYTTYKELLPEDQGDLHNYVDQQIEACKIAGEFMQNPIDVEFLNLGEQINSSNSDYKAVFSQDGLTLVFMQSLPFYDAVYHAVYEDGGWSRPTNITPQLMSDGDQFVSDLSADGKTLYLSKEDEFDSDIYFSRFDGSRWSQSQPLAEINSKYWESHASVSEDGKTMVFASNRKGGLGAMDLYISRMTETGEWGAPINMGSEVNTPLNEDTPFLTGDGDILFFSSQGFTSMGGYDVFRSTMDSSGNWTRPENLGYPVNTTDDDLFYFPTEFGTNGLMARILPDGYGDMDIYRVMYIVELPEPVTEAVPPVVVVEPEEEVTETEEIPVPPVVAEPVGMVTVKLQPVLFDFDRSSVSAQGKIQLDKLADLMKQHEDVTVLLTGYTDPLGPAEYNLRLSKQRAESVREYLVDKGISSARIRTAGKGETNFIAPNSHADGSDFPEGRKYNRRVEFDVEGDVKVERIDPVPDVVRGSKD